MLTQLLSALFALVLTISGASAGNPVLKVPDGGTGSATGDLSSLYVTPSGGSQQTLQSLATTATAHVANLAALKAFTAVVGQTVIRDGFATAGDGGFAVYSLRAGSCASADDGYQVQPTGTNCFIAVVPPGGLDIRVWGAVSTAPLVSGGVDNGPIVTKAFAAGVPLTCSSAYAFKTPGTLISGSRLTGYGCTFYGDAAMVGSAQAYLLLETNQKNILIRGMTFDGNSFNMPPAPNLNGFLAFVNGGDKIVFENSTFQNSFVVGVSFSGSTYPVTNSGYP